MILGDAAFEEVLLLLDVHHLGEPREGIFHAGVERGEAHTLEAAVGDVVDVGDEFLDREADGVDREAVADEVLFQGDTLGHGLAEFLLELGGPNLAVLLDEVHEEIPEKFDVVGLVAEGVAEHLADAGELVLPVKREDHAEEAVELGALHALAEDEDVFREEALVGRLGHVEVAAEVAADLVDELVLALDGLDVLEHRLALVRVDAERGNHVEERIGVDVLLVGVAAEHELQLGGGDDFADDVLDVVAHDALGGGEVTDAHANDPALDVGHGLRVAPLLDVLAHRDVLGLPVVRLHRLVEIVGPLELEREDVEVGNLAAVDDLLGGERSFSLVLIENEILGADGE